MVLKLLESIEKSTELWIVVKVILAQALSSLTWTELES